MKGIYLLLVSVSESAHVHVGALGEMEFPKGFYAYVGSAQNNLEKRVKRHLERKKVKFWHIDYLLDNPKVKVVEVFFAKAAKPEECKIARRLSELEVPVNGFGSSDCRCASHLFKIKSYSSFREYVRKTGMSSLNQKAPTTRSGWCTWITGLPGSGKSTVAEALIGLLKKEHVQTELLSSDALRRILTPKPKYSLEERDMVYATLVYVAELLTRNGVNVVIDATGNLRRYRQTARNKIPSFIEVYLKCPLEVCKEREARRVVYHNAPKRIYKRAEDGQVLTVPGVGQPYETPSSPELTLDTTECLRKECARKVLDEIHSMSSA